MANTEVKTNEQQLRKFLSRGILLLIAALAMQLIFHIFVAPNLRILNIQISGDPLTIGDQELLELMGLDTQPYYFSVNPQQVEEKLSEIPQIKEAEVERIFPDRMRVALTVRKPVVISLVDGGDSQEILAVDAEGVVTYRGPYQMNWDLPLVSGLRLSNAEPGSVFPERLVPVLRELSMLKSEAPKIFDQLSELRIMVRSSGDFDIMLVPSNFRTRVLMEGRLSLGDLQRVMVVLDLIHSRGLDQEMREIDFRTEDVVFELGEG